MVLGLLLGGLGSIAGSFIRDLVTGKKAGTSLGQIGSSAVKGIKSLGSSVAKGAKRIFGASSFSEGISEAGKVAKELGGTLGKGIKAGEGFLDVAKAVAPVFGVDTSALDAFGEQAKSIGGQGQSKLFELSGGLEKSSGILAGMGL